MQAKLDTVKKHMTGKRFNTAKGTLCAKQYKGKVCAAAADTVLCHIAEFETGERELMEEPDIETSEEVNATAHFCCNVCLHHLRLRGMQATSGFNLQKKQCMLHSYSCLCMYPAPAAEGEGLLVL